MTKSKFGELCNDNNNDNNNNNVSRLRWAGHVTRMGNERGAWKLLVGNPEGKRPVGRPRMSWESSINHDLREVDYTGDDWKTLAEDREVWRAYAHAAMNLRVR